MLNDKGNRENRGKNSDDLSNAENVDCGIESANYIPNTTKAIVNSLFKKVMFRKMRNWNI